MLEAINGNVVLRKIEEEEQMYGQIVIPDLGKERPEMGEVVAVSETFNWQIGEYKQSILEVGQKVLIPKMGAMTVSYDGEDYMIVKETDVLAIIKK
jgi:chaperonin GroES